MKALATKSKTWRSPAFGVLPPRGKAEVAIEVPLDLINDSYVLVSLPTNVGLVVESLTATAIRINNPTYNVVPFAVFFIQKKFIDTAQLDWRAMLVRLKAQFDAARTRKTKS